MSRFVFAGLGLLIALGGAPEARGQASNTIQSQAFARFRVEDKCVADATKAFPDHDLVSLQRRDGQVDQCMADHKLPPRAHLAPPSPTPATVEPPEDK